MVSYKKIGFFLILVLVMLATTACSQTTADDMAVSSPSTNSDGYTVITVTQLAEMLEEKDLTFVNVHVPYAGDIPQTDLSIPFDEVEANLNQLPADKDAPISGLPGRLTATTIPQPLTTLA